MRARQAKLKVFKDPEISSVSGFSFWAIDPIRKAGNDGKLLIWLNLRLFYCSVFFETVDYVFCLKELLWICFLLLSDVSGVSVKSAWPQLCLEYGFRQVNWSLLQYKDHKNIFLLTVCVFWHLVLFNKKLIAIIKSSWPYTFLFYLDICIKLTLPVIILMMEKSWHLTWCLKYIIKQLFHDKNILNMSHDKTISSKLRILK